MACADAGVQIPHTPGEFAKVIFDSLAVAYGAGAQNLSQATGYRFERLHIVGGGSRNAYLCQKTADTLSLPAAAGPAEATATGNILIQARVSGHIASQEQLIEVVEHSFPRRTYEPRAE